MLAFETEFKGCNLIGSSTCFFGVLQRFSPFRLMFFPHLCSDPAGSFCHQSLNPRRGSIEKPSCEINPFLPYPSPLQWTASLTDSGRSPHYLQADWFSTSTQGINKEMAISSIFRAPTGSKELSGNRHKSFRLMSFAEFFAFLCDFILSPLPPVVLSLTTKTVLIRARLGEPVRLDCSFWSDPSSPVSGSGFALEWRYQFRGKGRVVLAYNGKTDRLTADDDGATLDFDALHQRGDAGLILQKAEVHHTGLYICSVYLPYLAAQVTMELEVVGEEQHWKRFFDG